MIEINLNLEPEPFGIGSQLAEGIAHRDLHRL